MSDRERFALRLSRSPRDRLIADWIDSQTQQGFDVSQRIKDVLYELITGISCLTGRPLSYQGDVPNIVPPLNDDDPIAKKLRSFGD